MDTPSAYQYVPSFKQIASIFMCDTELESYTYKGKGCGKGKNLINPHDLFQLHFPLVLSRLPYQPNMPDLRKLIHASLPFSSNIIKALIFRNSYLVKGEGFGFVSIFRNQMLKWKH